MFMRVLRSLTADMGTAPPDQAAPLVVIEGLASFPVVIGG
jgi:hypothetical protein